MDNLVPQVKTFFLSLSLCPRCWHVHEDWTACHLCACVFCVDGRAWRGLDALFSKSTYQLLSWAPSWETILSIGIIFPTAALLAVTANTCTNANRRGHICFSSNIYKQYIFVWKLCVTQVCFSNHLNWSN